MEKVPVNKMKGKTYFVALILTLFLPAVLILRLFQLQIVEGEKYQKMAVNQQVSSTSITPQRGSIYDRNMKTLAKSATVWKVVLAPIRIQNDEETKLLAENLSVILDIDPEKIYEMAKDTASYYKVLRTKVEKDVADQVTAFTNEHGFTSVDLIEDSKRYYPYGSLASTMLGFTNNDNQGAYGIESYYNKVLSGTPGRVVSAKNGWGTEMPFHYQKMYEATDGNSIVLTIDEAVQHFAEKNLEAAVLEHGVKNRAVAIVMNVNTGEIYAMTSKNDFDPNSPLEIYDPVLAAQIAAIEDKDARAQALGEAQFEQWSNKAITSPMEPGSVFKIVTAAAALEAQAVTLESHFNCSGSLLVAGNNISCWKAGGHGAQNFYEAFKHSCNPAFILTGQALGVHDFSTYFDSFGLTEPTGIDLPGEAGVEGLYHKEANMGISELSSSAFGQTFRVTPIQMITAVAAAVNGGYLVEPFVVKQVLDGDGNVIETTKPTIKRQVISEETSKKIRYMMEGVVKDLDGSGRTSYIPGYRIGGKTGTSEKLDLYDEEGRRIYEYVLSFVGVAPIDNPEIAVLVVLDEPSNQGYGSVIAAPIVQAILKDSLPYLGIEAKYTAEELEKIDVPVPFVVGMKYHDAQSAVTLAGLTPRVVGSGTVVLKQVPNSGTPIPRGGSVLLYTSEAEKETTVKVPNVLGMSGQQANKTILNAGLNIKITGVGIEKVTDVASTQDPPPGTMVEVGTVVTVNFVSTEQVG